MLTPEQLKGKIRNVANCGICIETNMHMLREYDLEIL